jgi:predicted Fe-S protein YdhL (DUF1289 family)
MSVCAIGADGYCTGCLRTLDEISRWAVMGSQAQWQVMERLEARRAQRKAARLVEPPVA